MNTAEEYGVCPTCGGKCVWRERRPNGNDCCERGHIYPSSAAVMPVVEPVIVEPTIIRTASIAEQVISHRLRLGLTRTEFAKRIGVTERAIQYWESGEREPGGAALLLMRGLKKPKKPRTA